MAGDRDRAAVDADVVAVVDVAGGIADDGSPATVTRPAPISRSAARRDATPAWARYLPSRIVLPP